ncbi:glucans biosynthesis glucosyltransferase MdoH [Pseudotabrizicola alkalilacus]|uniref:Glucans biosynthesis glucosyltransferase H n=1 Tax=Pseudotabrizicola alkalilacus TaxID=2305252 RepID=A0A411YZR6_9RHOB|nr:glucans biosynthesis glucosyltransferase MdoH [Pseudotabrizicola alkalilacus]RGP36300.1 glucans biosynthesis glucosyltransferase MdoH [Pseudotabrizicola alkalilacus]
MTALAAALPPQQKTRTTGARAFAITFSVLAAAAAGMVFHIYGAADGITVVDMVRAGLIGFSTWWLAWGAATAMLGLIARQRPVRAEVQGEIRGRTVVIVPVYNEEPSVTFARIAAMDDSLRATGISAQVDFAILSDTRDEAIAAAERVWCARLLTRQNGAGRIFYRRRVKNTGRKAGNIEEFIAASGRAWDYAVILDADSLMEGETVLTMIRRMEADPKLGLLQTLPRVIGARSVFGRAMQFAASFHSPVFAHGLAAMQGRTGPFWGHNAIVRIRAWAESCGLPELPGNPPFGGHILSHDYVEAALLSRAGWVVRLDDDLDGSFEEGPENIIDHAKRDRRWCQGNLQHAKVIAAPGLKAWSRFVFFQGIFAYIAPLIWLGFIAASVMASATAIGPDYFPLENWPFPVFPYDQTAKAIGLALGIFGLLVMPKLLVVLDSVATGRAAAFGGAGASLRAMLSELLLSSLIAPVLLAFQSRSVVQVLLGSDGGWPPNNRGDGGLDFADAWAAGRWISGWGIVGLGVAHMFAPELTLWLLPVALPMLLAPVLIWWTSRPAAPGRFPVPEDRRRPAIVTRHDAVLAEWSGDGAQADVA